MFTNQQLPSIIEMIRSQGRNGDTMLAHINPEEAEMLKQMGGSGTINPNTGLPEFFFGIIPSLFGSGGNGLGSFFGLLPSIVSGLPKKSSSILSGLSTDPTIMKKAIDSEAPGIAPKAFEQMLPPKNPHSKLSKQEMISPKTNKNQEIDFQTKNSEEIFRPYDVSGIAGQMIGNAVLPGVGGLVGKQIGKFVGQKAQKYQYPSVQGVLKSAFETSPSYALSGRWEE